MYHYHGKLLHADPSTCTSHVNRKYVLRSDKMRWATSEQHLGKKSCSLRATFSKFRSNFLSFTCRQACLRLWRDFLYTRRMMVGSVVFWSPMVGRWDPFKAWPLSAVIANTSIIESLASREFSIARTRKVQTTKLKGENLRHSDYHFDRDATKKVSSKGWTFTKWVLFSGWRILRQKLLGTRGSNDPLKVF